MTALEYMEKQVQLHRLSHIHAVDRDAPEEMIQNIRAKIGYYEKAVQALQSMGEIEFDYDAED